MPEGKSTLSVTVSQGVRPMCSLLLYTAVWSPVVLCSQSHGSQGHLHRQVRVMKSVLKRCQMRYMASGLKPFPKDEG